MESIQWSPQKNNELKQKRGVSFDDLLTKGKLLTIKQHAKRTNQSIMLFDYKNYIWIVPFVKNKNGGLFLKTLFPSRKYSKIIKGVKK